MNKRKYTLVANRLLLTTILILVTSVFFIISAQPAINTEQNKQQQKSIKNIRVIHTSDMGFDDKNSLVRMLLFANNQNIIGITPSSGPWQNMIDNEYENILQKIDLY
jgi:signal transduction histidine kinase